MTATQVAPNPALVMDALIAYQRTACMLAAVDLGLFTHIAKGANTTEELARACNASVRGIKALADFLVTDGFLEKNGQQYSLSPTAGVFLNKESPAYMGSVTRFMGAESLVSHFSDMAEAVRRGGPSDKGATSDENDIWVDFAKGMAPITVKPAEMMADALGAAEGRDWKVLDIAAGHGMFGISIAKKNPNAKVVALDWDKVLTVATKNAQRMGVADRHSTISGDAFSTPLGEGYDVVLLTNFLHHFSPAKNTELLRKIKAALKPDGRVATLEFVPNEDRVSPPWPARFSLTMLAATPEGDAYTFSELSKMLEDAGFSRNERIDLDPSPQTLIISSAS
jgi:2-polyprenyl-3-methyl-5-hydroxy-6-metoxy-1,4-benzoquinol methylase